MSTELVDKLASCEMPNKYLRLKNIPGGQLVEDFAAEPRETFEWTSDVDRATLFYPDYAQAIQSRIKEHEKIETDLMELPRPCPNVVLLASPNLLQDLS
jgi:hypothetical protein